jgi:hypothetical protein
MKKISSLIMFIFIFSLLSSSNVRVGALGGIPLFWPEDESNISLFPQAINEHSFVQYDGVGYEYSDYSQTIPSQYQRGEGVTDMKAHQLL